MAYFSSKQVNEFHTMISDWLKPHNLSCEDIKTASDAWTVAHRSGVTEICYSDRNCVDAHIKTALTKIFPNAVFKDKYNY